MKVELDKLSLKELREIQAKVERSISSYEDRKRREALSAIENTAREYGFNLADLTGSKPSRAGTIAPKYANPDDATMTWTGRGRKPRWVIAALENGKTLDDLAI